MTYYGFDSNDLSIYMDSVNISFLHSTPLGYPAFAEHTFIQTRTGPGNFSTGYEPSSDPRIRDTGTVLRAFLPIRDPIERSLTTEYEGMATVIDTRVVCVKPNLTKVGWLYDGVGPRLYGEAKVDTPPPGAFSTRGKVDDDTSLSFNYSFLAAADKNYTAMFKEWPLSICLGKYRDIDHVQGMFVFGETRSQSRWLLKTLNAVAE
jgi:hypothetical protein